MTNKILLFFLSGLGNNHWNPGSKSLRKISKKVQSGSSLAKLQRSGTINQIACYYRKLILVFTFCSSWWVMPENRLVILLKSKRQSARVAVYLPCHFFGWVGWKNALTMLQHSVLLLNSGRICRVSLNETTYANGSLLTAPQRQV